MTGRVDTTIGSLRVLILALRNKQREIILVVIIFSPSDFKQITYYIYIQTIDKQKLASKCRNSFKSLCLIK